MTKIGITLETSKTVPQVHQLKKGPDVTTLQTNCRKLFNENHTIHGLDVKTQLKEATKSTQQKGRPIPIQLQQPVEKIEKLSK